MQAKPKCQERAFQVTTDVLWESLSLFLETNRNGLGWTYHTMIVDLVVSADEPKLAHIAHGHQGWNLFYKLSKTSS